jgi:hypothetical protein
MKNNDLVLNRFRPNSVGGRLVSALAAGKPRTVAELARAAKPRSKDNLLAPGGWFDLLRAYGKSSRKFKLEKLEDGKIQMIVRKGAK